MDRASIRRHAHQRRDLHPIAWWIWALGMATAVYRTSNPLLLLLVLAVLGFVVTARRGEAPWARGFPYYLALALIVVGIRLLFRIVFGGGLSPADHVLFRLPQIPLPHWYAGVQLGGPVSLEATLSAGIDGLRLACLLCCIGAANTLANPKRALRVLPGALYELGVAVTVSLSVAPQLIDSVQRVRRARRLRAGSASGLHALRSIAIPVLQDALERSLRLAASMASRGYGRTAGASTAQRRGTAGLLLAGMLGLCVGVYGLFDAQIPRLLATPMVLLGAGVCGAGLALGGRRVRRTSYRPDPWLAPEWAVAACGLVAAAALMRSTGYSAADLNPSLYPLSWPPLPVVPTLAVLVGVLPAFLAPHPARASRRAPEPSMVARLPVPA